MPPPAPLHQARVLAVEPHVGGLVWVRVDVAPEHAASHRAPGQYVYADVDGRTGYFALANREGKGPWEFLMRAAGGASEALLTKAPGDAILLSDALGKGFPVEQLRGLPLSVVVTAGAFGAVRSVVAHRVESGDAARTVLYLGTRVRDEVPVPEELERLAHDGVRVQISLSDETESAEPGIFGGFVQDRLRKDWDGKTAIFLAGFSAMLHAVRDLAVERGAESQLFFNH